MTRADFDWIFFDCFNTLIDDFDDEGDESGLGSLPTLATELGFFANPAGFIAAYQHARATSSDGREISLPERLALTLARSAVPIARHSREATDAIGRLMHRWQDDYARLIRPTPGVGEMLAYWTARKPAGVVSNFFLPNHPAEYLQRFGLRAHFRFVVDSAGLGYRKPHPRIFDHALEQAGLLPTDAARVLYIGDRNDLDIAPARQLGMQVIHFNRSRSRQKTEATPAGVRAIYDWAEFR